MCNVIKINSIISFLYRMFFRKIVFLSIFLFMAVYARADDGNKQTEAEEHDKNVISQSTGHPSKL